MKNTNAFKLFLIFIFAFLLRIWFLDKPEGLWNDEYVSWYIASQNDLHTFFVDMVRNCHTPFYYIYLKIWMLLFKDTDTILRYSSVIPSCLSVIVMYYSGKALKNEKLGYLCAFVSAISSFLIYFAQEVRLYSLLFLFSSLSVLFAIKVINKPDKFNFIYLFLSCAFIVLTHTLGIIYVFLLISFIVYYVLNSLEENKRKAILNKLLFFFLLPLSIIVIIIAPFLYNILTYNTLSQFWSYFSFSKVFLTVTDYLSPIQANIINTPDTISTYLFTDNHINFVFAVFAIIPAIIGIYGIINAVLKHNKTINMLLLVISIFFIYLILISYTGRMVLITKYSIELYPALILAVCYGLYKIDNKKLKYILIFGFIILHLTYIFFASDSAQRRTRPEGHRAVVELLRHSRLKNNDFVILTYYDKDKFERYLTDKDNYRFYSLNKFNFNYYLYNNADYKKVINSGKNIYRDDFNNIPNKRIEDFAQNTFIKNMKKNERIGLIFLNSVSFLSNENIKEITSDDKKYNKTPYIFMVFSLIKNSLMASFKDDFKIDSITYAGDWTLIVYKKKN